MSFLMSKDWDVSPMREADAQVYDIVNAGHCPNINDVPVKHETLTSTVTHECY